MDWLYCQPCNEYWESSSTLSSVCLMCGGELNSVVGTPSLVLVHKRPKSKRPQLITKYLKNSSNLCLITSLSDTALLIIASFCNAPDTYNFAQTCKEFHKPSTEVSTRHFLSPPESKPLEYSQNNVVTNVASRLIQESLLHGLLRVLKRNNASISIDQAKELIKLQVDEMNKGRKVLLSGSAVVQAATGKQFDNYDLDFYCTRGSVPLFRELMLSFGYCCQSVLPCYGEDDAYQYPGETQSIHHVETFIPISEAVKTEEIGKIVARYNQARDAHLLLAAEGDEGMPQQNVDMSFMNFRNMCLSALQRIKDQKFPKHYPFTMSPKGNRLKCGSIELIVCMTSPEEVLTRFDLDICKCSFDGRRVQVVSIQDTFNSRTKSDRVNFINCYMQHFLNPTEHYAMLKGDINGLDHLVPWHTSNDMMMHIMQCFVNTANCVDHRSNRTVFGTSFPQKFSLLHSNENFELSPRFFLALHNKLIKQFKRALKYSEREIDIPISDTLTRLFLGMHEDITTSPLKRARH